MQINDEIGASRLPLELLKDSTQSSDELANELGFTDRYHFSKTFRRFLHMTPSQFRREIVSACVE